MNPDQWQQVKALFHEATDLAPEARPAFLKLRCNGDAQLLSELQLLLESHDEAQSFIEQPALAPLSDILPANESDPWKDQTIGNYSVLGEIGRGGMGLVLLAVRADDQFEHRVAIKVLRRGMDTEDILRRFRNERQILASLKHPNIAKLYDGGTTADGLPYFVMEHVEGLSLLQYLEKHNLSVNERLVLFRRICAAVQHAHQNLIAHRDLKPSNILVTNDGEVKLLDFGVAKLVNPEIDSGMTETQANLRVMTPEYASPEQVRGQHVTTATDIYSLGVILYEMLTGARPYKLKDRSPEELSRAICDAEPSKLSDAVSSQRSGVSSKKDRDGQLTSGNGQKAIPRSEIRNPKSLRGDIDNIVLKALRKEPERRYKSVDQFSEDIRRHLEGLPVIARPLTFKYRASKFIKRHRVGVAAASLLLMSLIAGIGATAWQARRARQEQARAEEIKTFLERSLNYSNPLLTGKDSRETTVTEVLDEAAKRLDSGEFSQQPETKAELELIIGNAYNGQGKNQLAMRHIQNYVTLQRQLYGENDPKTLVALSKWANLLFFRGDMSQAKEIYGRVLPLMREQQQKGTIKAESLANALNDYAYLRRTQGDSKQAEALFREALALSPQLSADEWRHINGTTRSTLASTLSDQGRFEEALQTSREAVAEYRQREETDTPNFGFTLTVLGGFLTEQGNFDEADSSLRKGEAIIRKFLSPSTLWLGDNLRNQSISSYQQGKYAEALSKADEALNIYRETFGTHYDHYPTALIVKGLSIAKSGQPKEGENFLREAVKIRTESLPPGHYWVALAKSALGEWLMIQRRFDEAEPLLLESFENLETSQGKQNPKTLLARRRLVELYQHWHKPERAALYFATSIPTQQRSPI